MPECLNCGTELVFDDTLDEYIDNDDVILYETRSVSLLWKIIQMAR